MGAGESSIGDVRDGGDVDRVEGGRGDCIRGLVGGGGGIVLRWEQGEAKIPPWR